MEDVQGFFHRSARPWCPWAHCLSTGVAEGKAGQHSQGVSPCAYDYWELLVNATQ